MNGLATEYEHARSLLQERIDHGIDSFEMGHQKRVRNEIRKAKESFETALSELQDLKFSFLGSEQRHAELLGYVNIVYDNLMDIYKHEFDMAWLGGYSNRRLCNVHKEYTRNVKRLNDMAIKLSTPLPRTGYSYM